MEALAAGNTGIEISRTHYEDCVGRLCRAMVTFRDAAVNQDQGASREKAQQAIVAALGDGLQRMAQGQIDYRIETPFPPAFEKLRDRKRVVSGKSEPVRVDIGGGRYLKKKKK